jgi:plastocyanin
MHFTKSAVIGFLPAAFAANHQVIVGANNGLTFTPNTVTAAVGDTVQYMFATQVCARSVPLEVAFTNIQQNHTVTSGNPNVGCTPSNVFNSGFVPAPGTAGTTSNGGALPSFTVAIQNTNPVTVYCAQAIHCQSGMVMVINPTTSGATSLQQYQALSAKAKANTPAKAVNGGTLANLVKTSKSGTAAGAASGAGTGAAAGTTGTAAGTGAAPAKAAKGKGKGKGKKAKKTKRALRV